MAKTLIIVEDKNDKITFEAIINHMRLDNLSVDVSEPVDVEWKAVSAESDVEQPTALIKCLRALKNDIYNDKFIKIGLIRDMDSSNEQWKIDQYNNAISAAFNEAKCTKFITTDEFGTITFPRATSDDDEIEVKVACHFVGLNGKGEVEDLLKAIKNQPSQLADCVDAQIPICLEKIKVVDVDSKELVKLWVNIYQRYDNLQKGFRNSKNTTWQRMMSRDLFDFNKVDVPELVALKAFLRMMSE